MKFNVWFTIRGPAKTLEVPSSGNPVGCDSLAQLLWRLVTGGYRSVFKLGQ